MSIQCPIVASGTAPVLEMLEHERPALLIDFFKPTQMVHAVCRLLEDSDLATELGSAARDHAVKHLDLHTVCLPQQIHWVQSLAK